LGLGILNLALGYNKRFYSETLGILWVPDCYTEKFKVEYSVLKNNVQ